MAVCYLGLHLEPQSQPRMGGDGLHVGHPSSLHCEAGPSSWHPQVNEIPESCPGLAAEAAGLGHFLVSLLILHFLHQPRDQRGESGWGVATELPRMPCPMGGGGGGAEREGQPSRLESCEFYSRHTPCPCNSLPPAQIHQRPTPVWAGAVTQALRGHSPCGRQKMPLPHDIQVLDPSNVFSSLEKETFADVVKEC